MDHQHIIDYCLGKKGAWVDFPFGDGTMLIKVSKHYFATVFNLKGRDCVTLRCEPTLALLWRERYPEYVTRGYHCPANQQPTNNTVYLDGDFEDEVIEDMINHSYGYVYSKLTKKEREEVDAHVAAVSVKKVQ